MIMKSSIVTLLILSFAVTFSLFLSGCSSNKDEVIVDTGGAGDYKVTNVTTGESLTVLGASVSIFIGENPNMLKAHNGDKINIEFVKAEKYAKYSFITKFILYDGKVIDNENPYDFIITDVPLGVYDMVFSVKSTEQAISSNGSMALKVIE